MSKAIYLAGPIMLADDPDSWRDRATSLMPLPWEVINPRHTEKGVMTDAEIVALDYGCILRSRAVLAAVEEPSWGTAMEIAFAFHNHIPVVAWGEPVRVSKWLRYHSTVMVPRLEDGIETILRAYQ